MNRFLPLGVSLVIASALHAAPIVPVVSSDATALANAILGGVPGITIDSAALATDGSESGTFTGASGLLPFDTGVFLTNGNASCIPGPNNSSVCSGAGSFSMLTINFTPTVGSLSLQYVFGSEEYPPTGAPVNDGLTILLNGTNIALVPVTLDVISISTVNSGQNAAFFTDNSGGGLDLQYNGFAGIASALFATGGLNVGVSNTLVIRIDDALDSDVDSGAFISAGAAAVPEPATYVFTAAGLIALAGIRRRKQA